MTSQVGINFNIKLVGDDVSAAFRNISASMAGVHASTKKVRESWQGVVDGFQHLAVAGAAVGGAAYGLFSFAKSATDAADDVGDLATRYGVASEAIQVYGDLVKDAGGSTEDAAAAFKFLNKSMHGAIYGNEKLQAAFAGVGLSVNELKGLSPEQVMERVADAFQGSNNELEKQAVLTALMGKNGTVMMGVMNGGSQAIRDHYAQMNADGRLFTQEQLANADAFAKQWQRTAGVLEGMKNTLGLELMGVLMPVIEQFRDWALANKEVIATRFKEFIAHIPPLMTKVAEVAGTIGDVFTTIAAPIKTVSHLFGMGPVVWGALVFATAPLIVATGSLAVSMYGLASATIAAAAPFALVIGAFALAGVAAYLMYTRWDGIVGGAKALWSDLGDAIGAVGAKISAHWEAMKGGAVAIWTDISNFFSGIVDGIVAKFESLKNMMPSFGGIGKMFSGLTDASASGANMAGALSGSSQPAGDVGPLLSKQQQVSGEIRIKVDSEGRAKVAGMDSKGGFDLFADTGMYGEAM